MAMAARVRAHCLRFVSGRERSSHRHCLRLAIPIDRNWHGGAFNLCGQSALIISENRNSGRSFRREHRLQRLPGSETRYSRVQPVLCRSQHPADVCARSCWRRTLRLHRRNDSLRVDRASVPASSSKACSSQVNSSRRHFVTSDIRTGHLLAKTCMASAMRLRTAISKHFRSSLRSV